MNRTKILSVISAIFALIVFSASAVAKPTAKYVFLFIGDGMGTSHVDVTESYLSYKAGKLGGEQLLFTTFPVFGTATNYSANSPVTDSSAAGTAIACGGKTNNSWLGVDPEGNPYESVAEVLKDEYGYKVAVISNVPVNHATPASFYGHNKSRHANYEILKECTASTTTMALSTTVPITSTSANRVIILRLKPATERNAKVPISDTMIASAGISVERKLCKKI